MEILNQDQINTLIDVIDVIDKKIEEQGFCYCALVGQFHGQWRDSQLPNESFPSFLERILPSKYLFDKHNSAYAIFVKPAFAKPASVKTAQKKSSRMQEAVFGFAFIPTTPELTRSVQELTENSHISITMWRDAVIQTIGEYLLGERKDYYDDNAGDHPKIAFPLSLSSKRSIFAILEKNTLGRRQFWRLAGFSYPGNADANGWGKWLCASFKLPSENQESVLVARKQVQEYASKVTILREHLMNQVDSAKKAIEEGKPVPQQFLQDITDYSTSWRTLRSAMDMAFLDIQNDSLLSIGSINDMLKSNMDIDRQFDAIFSRFQVLAQATWKYLENAGLCSNAEAGIAKDCATWQMLCKQSRESILQLRAFLGDYSAFSKLLQPVSDLNAIAELETPRQIVEQHFMVKITAGDLISKFLYGAHQKEETFGFLNEITNIENLLTIIESNSDEGHKIIHITKAAAAHQLSGIDLTKAILNGGRSIGAILADFPAPSPLEIAIMEGNTEYIMTLYGAHKLQMDISDISEIISPLEKVGDSLTPYFAGLRLANTIGNKNRQAERCFLSSLAVGNSNIENSAQELYLVYFKEKRWDELNLLLDYATTHSLDGLAKKIIEKLFRVGRMDCRSAAQSNVLLVLAPEYREALREEDSELYETVQKIANVMENSFARYVVYLDEQLRDYILLQENIAELNKVGIHASGEALLRLVQSGNYSKGTDALSVSRRCYSFLGTWGNLAELFLSIIPADNDTRSLLFQIAKDNGDTKTMLELLKEDSLLREKHEEEYNTLLFDAGDYDHYLTTKDTHPIRRIIAEISVGVWNGSLPDMREIAPEEYALLHKLLNDECLEQITCAAIKGGDPCLALYTAKEASSELVSEVEGLIARIKKQLDIAEDAENMKNELHRIEVLCPNVYSGFQRELLTLRYRRALNIANDEDRAAALTDLILRADCAEVIEDFLEMTSDHPSVASLCQNQSFLGALDNACKAFDCEEKWVAFCQDNVESDNFSYASKLIQRYISLLTNNRLSIDMIVRAESFVLEWLYKSKSQKCAFCLLLIEGKLNNLNKTAFVLKYLLSNNDALSDKENQFVQEQALLVEQQLELNEFLMFRQVIEDESMPVQDYLSFCKSFHLCTDQDIFAIETIRRSYATDQESISILHYLYDNYPSIESIQAAIKLPLYDHPELYASFVLNLCIHGSKSVCSSDNEYVKLMDCWTHCAQFCLENELFNTLLRTLQEWSQAPAVVELIPIKWYNVKNLFTFVERTCAYDWGEEEWSSVKETTSKLASNLIYLFFGFNSISDGNSNHNSLRALINLVVCSENELLALNDNAFVTAIYGPYKNLGYVLAVKLLRCKEPNRVKTALSILNNLDRIGKDLAWHWLIHDILSFNEEKLYAWLSSEAGQSLIDLSLPDGNNVNEEKLHSFVMKFYGKDNADEGIAVLKALLEERDDVMAYNALFVLSKTKPVDNIENIHNALEGMIKHYPITDEREQRNLFTRSRSEMVGLFIITQIVLTKKGLKRQTEIEKENSRSLRDFYLCGANNSWQATDRASFVTRYQNLYNRVMRLYDGNTAEVVTLALAGIVSGNWLPFLKEAWENHRAENLQSILSLCCLTTKDSKDSNFPNYGLKRSCLLFMKSLSQNERIEFVQWLKSFSTKSVPLRRLDRMCRELSIADQEEDPQAYRFYDIDNTHEEFLSLPLEEHFVCLGTWHTGYFETVSELTEIHSCFEWMRTYTSPSKLPCAVNLFFSLAQDQTAGRFFRIYADLLFRERKDEYATAYYDGLYYATHQKKYPASIDKTSLCGNNDKEAVESLRNQLCEIYQARQRITGSFSGIDSILNKTRGVTFNKHSVFNMVCELLSTERRNELHSLCKFFHAQNRQFAIDLMNCVSSDVKDVDKMEIRAKYACEETNLTSAYGLVTYLLSRKYSDSNSVVSQEASDARRGNGEFIFIRSAELGQSLRNEADTLVSLSKYTPVLLWPGRSFTNLILKQTEAAPSISNDELFDHVGETVEDDSSNNHQSSKPEEKQTESMPYFILETGLYQASSIELDPQVIIEEYQKLNYLDYEERVKVSRDIYLALAEKDSGNELQINNAIVTYGINLYIFHHSGLDNAQPAEGDKILCELALWMQGKTVGQKQLAEMSNVAASALIGILGDYQSVDALTKDISANHSSYTAMASLSDAEHLWLIDIVNILSALVRRSSMLGAKSENEDSYRTLYSEIAEQILNVKPERGSSRGAETLKSKLHRIILFALNEMENRPDLEIVVFNKTSGLPNDALYGEVTNVSAFPIDSVSLLFTWIEGDKQKNDEYKYCDLQPQGKKVFALYYSADSSVQSIKYNITVNASARGKKLNIKPCVGVLEIVSPSEDKIELPANLYTSDQTIEFYEEDGEILPNSGFYGREEQMAKLRGNVAGDVFSGYNNQLVRGIRRSGKTSLLNYFKTYCKHYCKNAIVFDVDCTNSSDLRATFIQPILNQLPMRIPSLYDHEIWNRFESRWQSQQNEDCNIDSFYGELGVVFDNLSPEIPRKGILLVIDEFSALLANNKKETAERLLRSLRAIMQRHGNVVKFTFCASNDILKYDSGGIYNQFLQCFQESSGTEIIVDDLPDSSMRELLRKPCEGVVEIPDSTLDWFYRYAGGLVWYTKLLGNSAVGRARQRKRKTVYPSDVVAAFTEICNYGNCQQLTEGCSDEERLLISTIADMSINYREIVARSDIWARVSSQITWEVFVNSLSRLMLLRLLEMVSDETFRFRKELYRRYFRSQVLTSSTTPSDEFIRTAKVSSASIYGDDPDMA